MSYMTPTEFIVTLSPSLRSQLSAESGTTQDDTIVQACLDKATAEIDSRIGSRYTTPVTTPTVVVGWLKQKESVGASWFLWEYRGYSDRTEGAAAALESWKSVLSWCDEIAKGDRDLPGATERSDLTEESITASSWASNDVVFDKDNLARF